MAREKRAWMHTDAVQALGKIPVDFEALGVHAMTISAHKIYGPKGVGALVVDKRLELKPIIHGGGHEMRTALRHRERAGDRGVRRCLRTGARTNGSDLRGDLQSLSDRAEKGVAALGAEIFGQGAQRIPNTTYFAFPDIDGETLVIELDKAGFAVASGAACSSTSTEPSATLLAMGVAPELARGAVRVSFGVQNTAERGRGFFAGAGATVLNRLRHLTAIAVCAIKNDVQ